ncbi:2-octaprenyl-6-methoxyphenyl hydroxylase, partial [Escherichia coli]|nr:2-octaprenyl-6-methoxyphenyl hydroxylase [Escherichia coli]
HCPDRVANVARTQSHVEVTLESGETLTGRVLVAADGTHSALATVCGVDWQQDPYEQLAVIANVATSVAHEGRAFERFTQHGPLAMLPMSDGRCSLVWCHPLERREEVLSWSDEKFCRELQSAFGWRLGKITHAGKRSAYPLALTRAAKPITHRTVLVGNAAQTLHPIAGQGFNLGMRDVMSLAETLTQAQERGEDMGDYGVLCRYQQRRQSDREATIGVTDSLVHLFANRWTPLVVGRNIGLMTMELFTPARDVLAQRTLGWVAR